MRKQAILIIAHNQFEILEMLLKLIDFKGNDIFIHIDKKVKDFDFNYYKKLVKESQVFFVKRHNVIWGTKSQIQVEYELFKEASRGEYKYYHLLSGVDLPLKTAEEIHQFFDNEDKQFIHFASVSPLVRERIELFHFFQPILGSKKSGVFWIIEQRLLAIQKRLRINRWRRIKEPLYFGSNWVSITHSLVLEVLKQEKKWLSRARFSRCADELFIQTISKNSNKEWIFYSEEGDQLGCMRNVDWERGNPYTWKEENFEELINSSFLFARKFSVLQDREVCVRIFEYLRKRECGE